MWKNNRIKLLVLSYPSRLCQNINFEYLLLPILLKGVIPASVTSRNSLLEVRCCPNSVDEARCRVPTIEVVHYCRGFEPTAEPFLLGGSRKASGNSDLPAGSWGPSSCRFTTAVWKGTALKRNDSPWPWGSLHAHS